jgi:transposase-like protein
MGFGRKGRATMTTPGDIESAIFHMFKQKMSPWQIAEATALPIDVVYRLLKRLEKELVKKEGVENYGEKIHI